MKVKYAELEEESRKEEELKILKMKQNGEELLRLNIEMMGNRERIAKQEAELDAAIVSAAVFKAKMEEEAEAEKLKAEEEEEQRRLDALQRLCTRVPIRAQTRIFRLWRLVSVLCRH